MRAEGACPSSVPEDARAAGGKPSGGRADAGEHLHHVHAQKLPAGLAAQ